MDKQIPVSFSAEIISSPLNNVNTNESVSKVKARVFTKYANRNGSYITDAVANQLIESAVSHIVPVVGFYDEMTQTWASHTGPILANAYGYVDSFLGWESFTDTDGIAREYAVFSVYLFTDYFAEANKIQGAAQSMELDVSSITGDWADFDGQEYYVYKTAKMLSFCVIGNHEPCFSVSSFFSKDNETKKMYESFSLLLSQLKEKIDAYDINEGGKSSMGNEQENFENVENTELEVENEAHEEFETQTEVENQHEEVPTEMEMAEENNQPEVETVNFENLYNELLAKYEAETAEFNNKVTEYDAQIEKLNSDLQAAQKVIDNYKAIEAEAEEQKKNNLIEEYTNILTEEEIMPISSEMKNYSYEDLESKLAVTFSRKNIKENNAAKVQVPLANNADDEIALFMSKYKKNR